MAIPADIAVPLNLIPFNPIYCLKVLWHLTQELHSGLVIKHSSQPNGLIHCQSNIQSSAYPGRCLQDHCKCSTLPTDSTKKTEGKKKEKLTEFDNLRCKHHQCFRSFSKESQGVRAVHSPTHGMRSFRHSCRQSHSDCFTWNKLCAAEAGRFASQHLSQNGIKSLTSLACDRKRETYFQEGILVADLFIWFLPWIAVE